MRSLAIASNRRIRYRQCTYKLGKKFGSNTPYSEPIVNIYLSADEYDGLSDLAGIDLIKYRYHDRFEGRNFSIDLFQGELHGLVLCEIEAASVEELLQIVFPPYATLEVSRDRFFTGGNLCKIEKTQLDRQLTELGFSSE